MAAQAPSSLPAFIGLDQIVPIRNLSLRAKLIVEGMVAGLHRSPYHGFSVEFREYRPYLPGEGMRAIDWRKFAKNDRAVVRLFDDETNLYATILLDTSASMGFHSRGKCGKFEYARTLAASLAWILVRQRDAAGLVAFDDAVRLLIPPRSTNAQLKLILSQLERMDAHGATGCGQAINAVAQRMKKRGLSILLSDFLDDPQAVAHGLRHLRFKRQDVIALWVLDPLELDFSLRGSLWLTDAESGGRMAFDAQAAAAGYAEGFAAHREALERVCRDLEVDLFILSTDDPPARALLWVLDKRNRMY